jgi:hypothetical protein
MAADEFPHQPEDHQRHPWPSIMSRERREMLVPNLLYTRGVTTIVGPPGGGKTTLMFSIALTVGASSAHAIWDGVIKPRPSIWIAGEGQDDLRPIYEAYMQEHPSRSEQPQGWFYDEAFDFSIESNPRRLIKDLKGMPPSLITADALSDMLGSFNPDNTKDMVTFYNRVWQVVLATNSVFSLLHHTGWDPDRERNSSVIRQKSDIVALVTEFNPKDGFVWLTHKKRRGGPLLAKFGYDIRLVSVAGYPEMVPIVTGKPADGAALVAAELNRAWAADEEGARQLVQIVMQWPEGGGKPTYNRLKERAGMTDTTFERARAEAVNAKQWLTGGGKGGYCLNPDGCWKEALASAPAPVELVESPPSTSTPKGGWSGVEAHSPPIGGNLEAIGGGGESSVGVPSEQAEEALALTINTAALLKKIEKG